MKNFPLKQGTKRKKVTFSLEAPAAGKVILTGDFNNWNPRAHPMKNDGTGMWRRTVMLEPGKYEYKFLIDGDWKIDPGNSQTCPNCFGTRNNVLTRS
jgi:1,4-alpha-glucan branching enzyme